MAGKRGRTIVSFGQLFVTIGVDSGRMWYELPGSVVVSHALKHSCSVDVTGIGSVTISAAPLGSVTVQEEQYG